MCSFCFVRWTHSECTVGFAAKWSNEAPKWIFVSNKLSAVITVFWQRWSKSQFKAIWTREITTLTASHQADCSPAACSLKLCCVCTFICNLLSIHRGEPSSLFRNDGILNVVAVIQEKKSNTLSSVRNRLGSCSLGEVVEKVLQSFSLAPAVWPTLFGNKDLMEANEILIQSVPGLIMFLLV